MGRNIWWIIMTTLWLNTTFCIFQALKDGRVPGVTTHSKGTKPYSCLTYFHVMFLMIPALTKVKVWVWYGKLWTINPFTPKISLVILLTISHMGDTCIQFLWCQFGEFGIGSTYNLLTDIFLYSHYLSPWYCIDIVRRDYVLVTHGS